MNNNKLLPFSRNRYYKGKMLTSLDFEAEQRYMNDKRRFLNTMVTGCGIVCGLNVISLDDQSILVESGVAIDETGREIVVENSVVKKLSAVTGFGSLKTNNVCLGIRYMEAPVQPVYAINRLDNDKEYENNRIEEGYELFLQDIDSMAVDYEPETEFYTGGVLLNCKDYNIQLRMPAYICAGQYVKFDLVVEKLSDNKSELYYDGVIQTPSLSSLYGEQELQLKLEGVSLAKGQKFIKEYWMSAQTEAVADASVMFKPGSGRAIVDGIEQPIVSQLNCKVAIVDESVEALTARQTAGVNMELRGIRGITDSIALANITISKTGQAYLIEAVKENGVKKYIPTMRDAWKRMEYSEYFSKKLPFYDLQKPAAQSLTSTAAGSKYTGTMPRLQTGIVEIPIGENARKGDVCYSGEIMHGLGAGNVYVEVGYEYLSESPIDHKPVKTTIYGNPELFENDKINVDAQTAVKVFNDKGSFMVAVKLLQNVRMLVLTYRWVAIRYDSENPNEEAATVTNQSISAMTPTIVLGTKESYFFQVKFNNMNACSVSYELSEGSGGEISPDGVYTAPAKEGVYEIKIFCTDNPLICTYVYAIVKKKAAEKADEENEKLINGLQL